MVMTLPICYKENALILLRFQQDPAPTDAEIGTVHRLKKKPGVHSTRALLILPIPPINKSEIHSTDLTLGELRTLACLPQTDFFPLNLTRISRDVPCRAQCTAQ